MKKEVKKKSDEIEILDEPVTKKTPKEKKKIIYTCVLITCIMMFFVSLGGFLYIKNKEKNINDELNILENGINEIKDKMNNNQEIKKEKESEYEKLKEEVKDKFEELEIWENLKEKLNQSLA